MQQRSAKFPEQSLQRPFMQRLNSGAWTQLSRSRFILRARSSLASEKLMHSYTGSDAYLAHH